MTEERREDTAETPAAAPAPAEPAPATPKPPTPPTPPAPTPPPAASIAPDIPPPALEGITDPVGPPPSLGERRPEVFVGAAFVGGILLAHLIRRRGD